MMASAILVGSFPGEKALETTARAASIDRASHRPDWRAFPVPQNNRQGQTIQPLDLYQPAIARLGGIGIQQRCHDDRCAWFELLRQVSDFRRHVLWKAK